MSEPVKIGSHYEEGKELLPSQFYEKPYINAHLKAMLDGCQDVEDSFYQFLYTNKLYKTATFENLTIIGRLFGVERSLGEEDYDLRRRINAEILRRNSEGTPNSVKKLMSSYTGLSNMRIFEHSASGVVLYGETTNTSYELDGEESSYLKSACPVTTGSCVVGLSYSDQYVNTLIPAELDLTYYNLIVDGNCRDYFNFNGDGYITAPRRWKPDATDPSFVIEFRNDLSIVGFTVSQSGGFASSEEEVRIFSTISGCFIGLAGGAQVKIVEAVDLADSLWRFEYNSSQILSYKDGLLIKTTTVSLGTNVVVGALMQFMTRFDGSSGKDTGILSDVKMWVNGSTKETGTLVLDMPIDDNSTSIKDYAPSEAGVLSGGTGAWIAVEGVGYQFDFNGDGDIAFPRMWNPDAVDPSFIVEFYNDTSIVGTILSQNYSSIASEKELQILSTDTIGGSFSVILGGTSYTFDISSTKGYARWTLSFLSGELTLYKDSVLLETKVAPLGLAREPLATIKLMARGSDGGSGFYKSGLLADVKMWINTETTNDLVLDAPINDNSNSIKNLTERTSGVLTEGTGAWGEICESEEKNLVTGAGSGGANIIVRGESTNPTTPTTVTRNSQLSEFTSTDAELYVNNSGVIDTLSLNTAGNNLTVSFEGIENDRAILLDSVQNSINSTVTQIMDAFNEVAP